MAFLPACCQPVPEARPRLNTAAAQLPREGATRALQSLQAELVQGHPHPICEGHLWGMNFLERPPPFSFLPRGRGWMATPGLPLCPARWAVTEPLAGSPRATQLLCLSSQLPQLVPAAAQGCLEGAYLHAGFWVLGQTPYLSAKGLPYSWGFVI